MVNIGVIGYGYWGPNLVRNFAETAGSNVVAVSDLDEKRLARARARYPSIDTSADFQKLIRNPKVDAVAIATPVSTHFDLAMDALKAGKHVLVEKPMTRTSGEAMKLIDEAARRKLVLMVDHTFVYTGAVKKIHELAHGGDLGEIYYYDSVRINLGLFQHDVNVIWDLAVHDLAIMDYALPHRPVAVSATGSSHVKGQPENVAYITFFFGGTQIAHVHVNWLAPVKIRKLLIGGSKKMIVYDDLELTEKVKIYDKGVTMTDRPENVYRLLVDYRVGDMWAPYIEHGEALKTECRHFVECVEKGTKPITDGEVGLRVVRLLEAATESMAHKGQLVELFTGERYEFQKKGKHARVAGRSGGARK